MMLLAQQPRPTYTSNANDGSRTITIHDVPTSEGGTNDDEERFINHPRPVLKLRGGPRSAQRVAWKEEVVDNENCGKKKSKSTPFLTIAISQNRNVDFALLMPPFISLVCCIYHKPKRFDESSDESDESGDDGSAKPSRLNRPRKTQHDHHHDHPHDKPSDLSGGSSPEQQTGSGSVTELEQPSSPNAYEIRPRRPAEKNAGPSFLSSRA